MEISGGNRGSLLVLSSPPEFLGILAVLFLEEMVLNWSNSYPRLRLLNGFLICKWVDEISSFSCDYVDFFFFLNELMFLLYFGRIF